jgi:2-polyprenyl-3-methyl-5-hydroxy-6-metoxy-1,4-benzoquinol methylase
LTIGDCVDPRLGTLEGQLIDIDKLRKHRMAGTRYLAKETDYYAEIYDRITFHEKMISFLGKMIHGKDIVDIGCGGGNYLPVIAKYHARSYIGCDCLKPLLFHAAAKSSLPLSLFVAYSGKEIPIANESCDIVLCLEVIEHVDKPDQLLENIFRIVKPGGIVLISTPTTAIYLYPHFILPMFKKLIKGDIRGFISDLRLQKWWRTTEKHWDESLPSHPALRPVVFRNFIERVGFHVICHKTLFYNFFDGIRPIYHIANWLEDKFSISGKWYNNYINLMDSVILSGIPFIKWAGIRQFIICQKK